MKSAIVFLLAMSGAYARAETFSCAFTEPFVDVTYDTSSQIVTVNNVSDQKKSTQAKVAFQVVAAGVFSLKNAQGKEIARLELNNQGSDGMSNDIYPYTVTTSLVSGANSGIGGCSSSLLPVQKESGD